MTPWVANGEQFADIEIIMSLDDEPTGYQVNQVLSYLHSVIFTLITSISCWVGRKLMVPVLGLILKKVDVTGCVAEYPASKGMFV